MDFMNILDESKFFIKSGKRLIGLVVLCLCIKALTIPVLAQAFLDNGLVAYYPFTGNANDASGNGNNGTVIGATLTENMFGASNAAYAFDGISNYIEVPAFSQTNNSFTMSLWLKAYSWTNIPASTPHVDILVQRFIKTFTEGWWSAMLRERWLESPNSRRWSSRLRNGNVWKL